MLLNEIAFTQGNNTNYEKLSTIRDLMLSLENEENYNNYRNFYKAILPDIINSLINNSNRIEDINQNNTLKTLLNVIKKSLVNTETEAGDDDEVKKSLEKNFKRDIKSIIS